MKRNIFPFVTRRLSLSGFGLFSIFLYPVSHGNQQTSSTIGYRSGSETISRLEQGFHLPQQWRWVAGVQGGHREVSITH